MPPSLERETFKRRVGDYYLGRTIGEVGIYSNNREISTGGPGRVSDVSNLGYRLFLIYILLLSTLNNQGTYAKVKYGQHVVTGLPVAVKIIEKKRCVSDALLALFCSAPREH